MKNGFTIIELMIVVIVIGILAGIVIVAYNGIIGQGHDAAIQSDLDAVSDQIDLSTLDNNVIPAGGATSAGAGTATNLDGVRVRVSQDSYDTTVTNLYYCTGEVGGETIYAIVSRSKSGKQQKYVSNAGISEVTGYTFSASPMASTVCADAGFTDPYTYSYGYHPSTGWAAWANK